jgi:hypothetical protein
MALVLQPRADGWVSKGRREIISIKPIFMVKQGINSPPAVS